MPRLGHEGKGVLFPDSDLRSRRPKDTYHVVSVWLIQPGLPKWKEKALGVCGTLSHHLPAFQRHKKGHSPPQHRQVLAMTQYLSAGAKCDHCAPTAGGLSDH